MAKLKTFTMPTTNIATTMTFASKASPVLGLKTKLKLGSLRRSKL